MTRMLPLLIAIGLTAACSDSDPVRVEAPLPAPPPPAAVDFTGFVKQQLDIVSKAAVPVEVNEIEFEYDDLDDPNAYDDVFANGN